MVATYSLSRWLDRWRRCPRPLIFLPMATRVNWCRFMSLTEFSSQIRGCSKTAMAVAILLRCVRIYCRNGLIEHQKIQTQILMVLAQLILILAIPVWQIALLVHKMSTEEKMVIINKFLPFSIFCMRPIIYFSLACHINHQIILCKGL